MSAVDGSETSSFKAPRRSRHPSTASIRSTASSRSPRPTVWRTVNTLRGRTNSLSSGSEPTLTTVVATPQITPTSTASARERMEAYSIPIAGPSSTSGIVQHEIEAIPEAESDTPTVEVANSITFPVSVSPTPSRSSWFGSLSRAKGKEKLVAAATSSAPNLLEPVPTSSLPVADPVPPPLSEPVTSSNPDTPERVDPFISEIPPPPPIPVTNKRPTSKRSWFATSPSQPSPLRTASPPQPVPQPLHIPSETASVASSIDSSVPLPVATPPADIPVSFPLSSEEPPDDSTVRKRPRLSSLNPAVGHFGIGLPLLGTKPVPVTSAAEDTSQSTETAEAFVQEITQATTISTSIENGVVEESGTQTTEIKLEQRTVQASTWWDYVGWSSGPAAAQPPAEDDKVEPTAEATTPKPVFQQIPEDVELPAADEAATPTPEVTVTAASAEQPASWYSPWAWYGYAPPNPNHTNDQKPMIQETETQPDPVNIPVEPEIASSPEAAEAESGASLPDSTNTAAQQKYWTSFFSSSNNRVPSKESNVKLPPETSTMDPTETSSESSPSVSTAALPKTPSSVSLPNPVADSMTTQRASWVSFFNTGTLGYISRKTVTSGEPEIMEIDVDDIPAEEEASKTTAASPPPIANTKTEVKAAKRIEGAKDNAEPKAPKEDKPAKVVKNEVPSTTPLSKNSKSKPTAPPLTISESVKKQVANNTGTISSRRSSSPAPSVASRGTGSKSPKKPASIAPPRTPTPNLVLPTWADTFHTPPRSVVPQRFIDGGRTVGRAVVEKTMKFVSGVLFAADGSPSRKRRSSLGRSKSHDAERRYEEWGLGLPRAWDILKPAVAQGRTADNKEGNIEDVLRGCKRVAIIGIHGWFPGAVMRSVLGEPTGTSTKFVNMMVTALEDFQTEYDVRIDKITKIPLEGEGTIDRRVEKLYTTLTSNSEWMDDIHAADVIFVATHSQGKTTGSIVSTHILNRLITDGHIQTGGYDSQKSPGSPSVTQSLPPAPKQRVCCLALCGIHLGPLRYLNSSSLLLPYIQYFESAAAKELFEFQNTDNEVSRSYVKSLENVLDNGVKMVYVASLNDQVVPIYSGLFTAASHPLILRSLYIDGDVYHSSDFLSNLLVLLVKLLNAGLSERLVTHLSEATAGSLNGVGHSTAYEEVANYSCVSPAVKYLFLTNSGFEPHPKLVMEPFNASTEQNDYEIPWSLRDMIADPHVAHFFSKEISELAAAFRHWSPKTTILRDVKRKLQPIQRHATSLGQTSSTNSKL
ncbi:hypothetical protein MIND_00467900 [Mycena indigotica]|uniref:YMC020W-like alpha/beta hydrolase domain-containing protein n=1 Tax=Mycena indigotica TaxID=2126181 RepID=A0A8H6SYQ9_9AGAR|nr:uncharacterized protein MIND_00467900 [Mycena indigotica]KAF7306762.1 hypothetical protein MIND_00467900 [Mycena indigotica]